MTPLPTPTAKAARKGPLGARRGVLGTLLYWAPVWLPGMLIGQIVFGGLKPSLAEQRRLDKVEEKIVHREERLNDEAALQEHNRRMLEDEIYRERVRKSIGIPGKEPLRLQHDLPTHK